MIINVCSGSTTTTTVFSCRLICLFGQRNYNLNNIICPLHTPSRSQIEFQGITLLVLHCSCNEYSSSDSMGNWVGLVFVPPPIFQLLYVHGGVLCAEEEIECVIGIQLLAFDSLPGVSTYHSRRRVPTTVHQLVGKYKKSPGNRFLCF